MYDLCIQKMIKNMLNCNLMTMGPKINDIPPSTQNAKHGEIEPQNQH